MKNFPLKFTICTSHKNLLLFHFLGSFLIHHTPCEHASFS